MTLAKLLGIPALACDESAERGVFNIPWILTSFLMTTNKIFSKIFGMTHTRISPLFVKQH